MTDKFTEFLFLDVQKINKILGIDYLRKIEYKVVGEYQYLFLYYPNEVYAQNFKEKLSEYITCYKLPRSNAIVVEDRKTSSSNRIALILFKLLEGNRIDKDFIEKHVGLNYKNIIEWFRFLKFCNLNNVSIYEASIYPIFNKEAIAYIIGVGLGDLGLLKDSWTLMLDTKYKPFAEKFAKYVRKIGLEPKFYDYSSSTGYYVVMFQNKIVWQIIDDLRKNPRKLRFVYDYLKPFGIKIIEGLFDSDGTHTSHREVRIINANLELLNVIKELLENEGIKATINVIHGKVHCVRIARSYVPEFFRKISPVYEEVLRSSQTVRTDIVSIISRLETYMNEIKNGLEKVTIYCYSRGRVTMLFSYVNEYYMRKAFELMKNLGLNPRIPSKSKSCFTVGKAVKEIVKILLKQNIKIVFSNELCKDYFASCFK